jgi:hypothetical protein
MSFRTDAMLSVTTIHDRAGRRVGSYLVDRSKDSLDRDRKNKNGSADRDAQDEEAVVFHHSEATTNQKDAKSGLTQESESSELNLTV